MVKSSPAVWPREIEMFVIVSRFGAIHGDLLLSGALGFVSWKPQLPFKRDWVYHAGIIKNEIS